MPVIRWLFMVGALITNLLGASTNDFFAERTQVTGSFVTSARDFTGATREPGEPHNAGASLWWEWTAPASGSVAVECVNSLWNPSALVFAGTAFPELQLVSQPQPVVNPVSEINSGYYRVAFRATAGQTYYIAACGNTNYTRGSVTLRLRRGPSMDDFSNALALAGTNVNLSISLHGATREEGDPVLSTSGAGASVWWKWQPGMPGRALVSVAAASEVKLALYRGDSLDNLVGVGTGTWDYITSRAGTVQSFAQNDIFYILVTDAYKNFETVTLRIQTVPQNDDFEDRLVISGQTVSSTVNIAAATREEGEPHPFPASLWWEWTAPVTGGVGLEVLSNTGAGMPISYVAGEQGNLLRVSIPPLLHDAIKTNYFFLKSGFRAEAGKSYYIALAGQNLLGSYTLRVTPGPANDDFENASVLSNSTVNLFSTLLGATGQEGEPQFDNYSSGASVWWKWTPSPGGYGLAASSTAAILSMSLYKGDALTNLTLIAADRYGDGGDAARVTLRVVENESFYIRVANWGYDLGAVNLKIFSSPANDDFANAAPITNLSFTGTTLGATREQSDPVPADSKGHTVWYKWLPGESASYDLRLANTSYSAGNRVTMLRLTQTGSLLPVASLENFAEQTTRTTVVVTAGEQYYLLVDGKTDGGSGFALTFTQAVSNDSFSARLKLVPGTLLSVNTLGSGREINEPLHNNSFAPRTLWYEFETSETSGYYLGFSDLTSGFAIYLGDQLASLAPVPSILVSTATGQHYRAFRAVAGVNYKIVFYDEADPRIVTLRLNQSPPNDDLAHAQLLVSDSVSGTTLGATREQGEPQIPGVGSGSTVWYKWIAPAPGTYGINIPGGGVLVFKGEVLEQNAVRPSANSPEQVAFRADAQEQIYIMVDTPAGRQFSLNLKSAPKNDDFAGRLELQPATPSRVDAYIATRENEEPWHAPDFPVNSLWWKFKPNASGGYRITVQVTSGTPALAVYTGSDLTSLKLVAQRTTLSGTSLDLGFYAAAGAEYAIAFGEAIERWSSATLSITPSSENDAFIAAVPLELATPLTLPFNGATQEPGELWTSTNLGTIWYRWVAPSNGTYNFKVTPGHQFHIGVFTGSAVDALTPVHIVTNWVVVATSGNVAFRGLANTTYYFGVAISYPEFSNSYTVLVEPGHPADDFINAELLSGLMVEWSGTTLGSTIEPGETAIFPDGLSASVWARWTAPVSGPMRIFPGFNSHVYRGGSLATLVPVHRAGPSNSREFNAVAGETYHLRVETPDNSLSTFALRLGPVPLNDDITGAFQLEGADVSTQGNNWVALGQQFSTLGSSVWWKWKAPQDSVVTLQNTAAAEVYHRKSPTISSNLVPAFSRYTIYPSASTNIFVAQKDIEYLIALGGKACTNLDLQLSSSALEPLPGRWLQAMPELLRGGTAPWVGQTNQVKIGPDALEARVTGIYRTAWIEAVYLGPGTLQYWVKAASQSSGIFSTATLFDSPEFPPFFVPTTNWTLRTLPLTRPTNIVRFIYQSDSRLVPRLTSGTVWLDGVTFIPKPPVAPRLTPRLLPGDQFGFTFLSEAQRTYSFEVSTNLVEWFHFTNILSTSTILRQITIPRSPQEISVFLRGSVY